MRHHRQLRKRPLHVGRARGTGGEGPSHGMLSHEPPGHSGERLLFPRLLHRPIPGPCDGPVRLRQAWRPQGRDHPGHRPGLRGWPCELLQAGLCRVDGRPEVRCRVHLVSDGRPRLHRPAHVCGQRQA